MYVRRRDAMRLIFSVTLPKEIVSNGNPCSRAQHHDQSLRERCVGARPGFLAGLCPVINAATHQIRYRRRVVSVGAGSNRLVENHPSQPCPVCDGVGTRDFGFCMTQNPADAGAISLDRQSCSPRCGRRRHRSRRSTGERHHSWTSPRGPRGGESLEQRDIAKRRYAQPVSRSVVACLKCFSTQHSAITDLTENETNLPGAWRGNPLDLAVHAFLRCAMRVRSCQCRYRNCTGCSQRPHLERELVCLWSSASGADG